MQLLFICRCFHLQGARRLGRGTYSQTMGGSMENALWILRPTRTCLPSETLAKGNLMDTPAFSPTPSSELQPSRASIHHSLAYMEVEGHLLLIFSPPFHVFKGFGGTSDPKRILQSGVGRLRQSKSSHRRHLPPATHKPARALPSPAIPSGEDMAYAQLSQLIKGRFQLCLATIESNRQVAEWQAWSPTYLSVLQIISRSYIARVTANSPTCPLIVAHATSAELFIRFWNAKEYKSAFLVPCTRLYDSLTSGVPICKPQSEGISRKDNMAFTVSLFSNSD